MSSNNAFSIPIFENFFPKLVFLLVQKKKIPTLFSKVFNYLKACQLNISRLQGIN